MVQQTVKSKPIKPVMGILMVLGVLVVLFVVSTLASLLVMLTNSRIPSAVVWLGTAAFAIGIMRNRVMEYNYTVNNDRLYIERTYGSYTKILLDVALMDVLAMGDEATLKEQHPDVRFTRRAWLKNCPIPKQTILYRQKGLMEFAVLQPDEAMTRAIWNPEKRAASNKDKFF